MAVMSAVNACLECRKVKMKCCPGELGHDKCLRCERRSLECIVRKHKRGRKPGYRLSQSKTLHQTDTVLQAPQHHASNESQADALMRENSAASTDAVDNFQPSGVLNREAMRGRFSLAHLLHPSDSDEQIDEVPVSVISPDDPMQLGMINIAIAKSLFDSFMLVLNPFISQLDPRLHTFAYVREKSAFLLTATLAASAKIFHPGLYPDLYEHAQKLSMTVFRQGIKTVEAVQAILILTYWKEPNDNRVWTLVGFAIRICMDLGWHALKLEERVDETEPARRERRNIQRTWLVLFVYDRSISLQTGKPYMIESDSFIESAEAWSRQAAAIENDQLLAALVTLRLEMTSVFSLMTPRSQSGDERNTVDVGPLLMILDRHIRNWENSWLNVVKTRKPTENETCHKFLIPFYGSHLRLQMYSLQIQKILPSMQASSANLDGLWIAYSSALRMLHLIPRHSSHLAFVQDSIHVMVAYSAAFLVKLLLAVPTAVAEPLEVDAISAICEAATTFANISRVSNSSSALQAKFLQRIATKLSKTSTGQGPSSNAGSNTTVSSSFVNQQGAQIVDSHSLDITFSDSGSWDDIFASSGLNVANNMFMF